jgi:hypothetical protein
VRGGKFGYQDSQNTLEVFYHLIVPEADHTIAELIERPGSGTIALQIVLPAVDLDDEPLFDAAEVDDILAERPLSFELVPPQSSTM